MIPGAVIRVARAVERDSEPGWATDDIACDNTRIREELEFRPSYDLEKGIGETIKDVRKWATL